MTKQIADDKADCSMFVKLLACIKKPYLRSGLKYQVRILCANKNDQSWFYLFVSNVSDCFLKIVIVWIFRLKHK